MRSAFLTMEQVNYWAVVPAAGVGKRMGADRPKQYLQLAGKTVIEHSLQRLCSLQAICRVVVAVSAEDSYWADLHHSEKVQQTLGGSERFHSVFNALQHLQGQAAATDWVLVHDAARPCVRPADIENLMRKLANHPVGGLLATPVRDTLKRANAYAEVTETVNRANLYHALTPQMFRYAALYAALEQVLERGLSITDDAQAMELAGHSPILLVESHADNIKITHPHDLALAELFLRQQA